MAGYPAATRSVLIMPWPSCPGRASRTDRGVRDKVGAAHFPLPALLHALLDAGLVPGRFAEGGAPVPAVLAIRAAGAAAVSRRAGRARA